ncbi:hypothetical protein FDP41_007107 [Naegleria fowleri]|uniref:Peptidase C39-like domain-containing protein n=1 Tax=Naegleria fowleri TaxID=5763 RepID=A0A6A5BI47_NAEFO|nr:uncharacterized protein FDP41_007107 [Naegleria fowleri]KAF0973720.1 hypothetical protein FDP41_007107 [Naegleria fowleri]CAG4716276.1 unnamed protein product [Naegleria fowleri]
MNKIVPYLLSVVVVIALFISQSEAKSLKLKGGACYQQYDYPLYKQCGQSWSSDIIYTDTICKSGCLLTSMTMALDGRGLASFNPGQFLSWLKSNGGLSGNLFVWGSVRPFGLSYNGKVSSTSSIVSNICNDNVVFLNVRNGGHWVLATGYDGYSFTVNDPGYSRSSYSPSEVTQAAIYS